LNDHSKSYLVKHEDFRVIDLKIGKFVPKFRLLVRNSFANFIHAFELRKSYQNVDNLRRIRPRSSNLELPFENLLQKLDLLLNNFLETLGVSL
jgi:hypothetical protein